jgi:hypothetical protein
MDPTPAQAAAAAKMKNRRAPVIAPAAVPAPVQPVAPAPIDPPASAPPASASFKPTEDPRRAAALKAKQRHLMESFCDMLHQRIRAKISSDSVSPFDFAAIGTFYLPTRENRSRDIHSCYWAGSGDILTEGTPIVQLLQGVRDHKTGKVHPEWLWGGQTAVANMKAIFDKEGWKVEYDVGRYTGNTTLTVYLVKPEGMNAYWGFLRGQIPCILSGVSDNDVLTGV